MNSWVNTVIIPCLNEEASIVSVIEEVRRCSPSSRIVVVDNGSEDRTAELAEAQDVEVLHCPQRGKGRAIQFALHRVESHSYTLVDGDGTYDLKKLDEFVAEIQKGRDMIVGQRLTYSETGSFPKYHVFGNHFFSWLVSKLFGIQVTDILSGFRVMSDDFVKCCPLTVEGFEMEAFYTLEAAIKGFSISEFPIFYRTRVEGGVSKLRTYRDGMRILLCIFDLFKTYKPMPLSLIISGSLFGLSLLSGSRPILEFLSVGYVYAVPRAVLAAALMILSFMSVGLGMILSVQIRNQLQNVMMYRNQKNQNKIPSKRRSA